LKIISPLFIFLSGIFFEHSIITYANIALTVFVTKAVVILLRLSEENTPKRWVSMAVILCGVVMVRIDGYAYFFNIALLSFIFICIRNRSFKEMLYLSIPFACVLIWQFYYRFFLYGSWFSQNQFSSGILGSYPFSLARLASEINNWPTLKIVSIGMAKGLLNTDFFGIMNLYFIAILLFRAHNIIVRHGVAAWFIVIGLIELFIFSVYILPLWGAELLFTFCTPRYYMTLVPIIFMTVLKEIDNLIYTKDKIRANIGE
jgi:hypothetical protein